MFQSNNREVDISIVKFLYHSRHYLRNDFIGPVGSYDIHFRSGAPPERKEHFTLIMPFDSYTWALIVASVVGVSISLILIDKMHMTWSNEPSRDTIFKSINKSEFFLANDNSCYFRYLILHWSHY